MKSLIVLTSAIFLLYSCSKSDEHQDVPDKNLTGTYSGTFKRFNSNPDISSEVSLVFSKKSWSGSGQYPTYPALAAGTYFVDNNETIQFQNSHAWTADFDWTLILDGIYLLHRNDDSLIFTRSYGNGAVDVYKLALQP